jgi:hemerythrin-like metal-binding protein
MGGQVLAMVAGCIQKQLRKNDLFARWGGEEFLIMLPEADLNQACLSAEKLRAGIESLSIDRDREIHLKVTMSFGVAEFHKLLGLDWTIIQADNALYQAKHSGRNCVKKADPDRDEILNSKIEWNPRWSSGNTTIDSQHKTLVEQLNNLQEMVRNQTSTEAISYLLDDMVAGLKQHFSDEEFFLEKSRYPDLENHKKEHVDLAKTAQKICDDFKKNGIQREEVVPLIINNILMGHLLTHDNNYFSHFLQKNSSPAHNLKNSVKESVGRG